MNTIGAAILMASATHPATQESYSAKATGAPFFVCQLEVQDWHNPARRQYVVTLSG